MPDKKKKNKKVIELQDLTPKKDVRGGVSANVNANVSANKSTNVSANRSTNVVSPNLKI
jgi:hypothetical protein